MDLNSFVPAGKRGSLSAFLPACKLCFEEKALQQSKKLQELSQRSLAPVRAAHCRAWKLCRGHKELI